MAHEFIQRGYGKQISWSKHLWLDMWGVWDSGWYMDIAQNGYSIESSITNSPQTNFPFFPLYPMAMKLLGQLTGGEYFLAGIFISNVCLLLSGYLLYKLVLEDAGQQTALRTVKYLFIYPVSFILSGIFTESLYLFLTLLCFYMARHRRWWPAGIVGAFLSATRTLGVLILLPLAFEYFQSIRFKLRKINLSILFLLLVPLGLLSFSLYNYLTTGDFLYFKTNQAAWGRAMMNPLLTLPLAVKTGLINQNIKLLTEASFCAGALFLLNVFYKKIGFTYWLFGMYSLVIPLAAGIYSMPRFTLPIFPLFILLAKLGEDDFWDSTLTLWFGLLQGGLMIFWCTGQSLIV
ncbi:MAG: hypothetical protein F6K11_33845 [Leptolyngbya sp. SIO3F4]|nr:hypothetical protein [Leptolyngbya sp. SIO3F4]